MPSRAEAMVALVASMSAASESTDAETSRSVEARDPSLDRRFESSTSTVSPEDAASLSLEAGAASLPDARGPSREDMPSRSSDRRFEKSIILEPAESTLPRVALVWSTMPAVCQTAPPISSMRDVVPSRSSPRTAIALSAPSRPSASPVAERATLRPQSPETAARNVPQNIETSPRPMPAVPIALVTASFRIPSQSEHASRHGVCPAPETGI